MIADFSAAYHKNTVYLGSRFSPAGTLACMALNLSKETISQLESLYKRQRKGEQTEENTLRDALYSLDCISCVTELLPDDCLELVDQLICFRAYIRHFLMHYDVRANGGAAWEIFLGKLDGLISNARNMDNYARTVFKPNLRSAAIVYSMRGGKLCEEVGLPYGDLLLFDLLRSMEYGQPPRLCPCCERWFIPQRGDEVYCDQPAPDSNGRTCREVGAVRMFAKRADNSQPLGLCRAACSRIYTRKNRGQLTGDEAAHLTAECRRLRDEALSGAIGVDELEEKLAELSFSRRSGESLDNAADALS